MSLVLAVLSACESDPHAQGRERAPEPSDTAAATSPADPVAILDRASLSLRGVHASPEDADRVRADAEALDEVVWGYVSDPRFGETVRDLHAEQLHLRWDVNPHAPSVGALEGVQTAEVVRSLDEASLRLIETIVVGGRPYTEIVTAPTTMADEIVAAAYGLARDPAGPEWQEVPWPDGRAAAGILAENGFLQRYQSAGINHHRARAAFVMASLVCDDVSRRDGLAVDVLDLSDPGEAVAEDPSCVACHSALDPIASAFWSARQHLQPSEINEAHRADCPPELAYACYPLQFWDPSLAVEREVLGLPPPAWYGTPVADLGELGQQIATDPRFASCTAERFWSWFAQVPRDEVPFEISSALAEGFVASGYDARALAVAVVTHPEFDRALLMRPEVYARFVEDLTGYRWLGVPDARACAETCVGEVELAINDLYGNHTLLGGADGVFVLEPLLTPTPVAFLTREWLAEEAAAFVVDRDLAAPAGERRLLVAAEPTDLSDAAVDAQLGALRARILGPTDQSAPEPLRALFDGALARHPDDVAAAYRLVITALLLRSEAW